MQRFRKYECLPTTWATLKEKIQITKEEGSYYNTDIVAVVVELGKLCKEWGTDEEGNPICINQNTKESIDIVWNTEPLSDFTEYEVWPLPVGVSSMGYTLDTEYAKTYCEKYPDTNYCQPPIIDEPF